MDIFDDRYWSFNKRILCALGQWPYQSVFERSLRTVLILITIMSLVTPQLIRVPQVWGKIDMVIECISPLITNTGSMTKLMNCVFNTGKMRKILEMTRDDWESMRCLPEIKVLRNYGNKGRQLTIVYFMLLYMTVTVWVCVPFAPSVLDFLFPLNESRQAISLFQTDYKIDPEKYFFLIWLHGVLSTLVIILIIIGVDTFYMSVAQHACAMLEILRSRLESVKKEVDIMSVTLNPSNQEDIDYQKIVACIKDHKRAMEFARTMEASYEWSMILVLGFNMFVMSFSGARCVVGSSEIVDVLRFALFTVSQAVHLYCNSLPGQWIMDSSSLVRDSAYNCKWYVMSLKSRKLIILLLRQTIQPFTITAGKLYVLSMENFSSVLQTSMSYFTLLTSLQ